jgi:hypothetical protein
VRRAAPRKELVAYFTDVLNHHANSIQDTNNQNFSQLNDPHIQSELKALNPVPAVKLDSVAGRWQKLDK